MSSDDVIATKAYYSIGEVCDLAGLKPHVLRYWETQFRQLKPTKNRAGNRVFKPKDIEVVLLIKHLLYEKKFTISGARRHLKEAKRGAGLRTEVQESVTPTVLAEIRNDLTGLLDVLTPTPLEESAAE